MMPLLMLMLMLRLLLHATIVDVDPDVNDDVVTVDVALDVDLIVVPSGGVAPPKAHNNVAALDFWHKISTEALLF